jgi:DNA-binding PadR family transcriptional regulator
MARHSASSKGSLGRSNEPPVLILTSLAGGPTHGYALTKDIEKFAGVTLGPASLYGAIARLEERGLIEPEPVGSDERRRPYRITGAGRVALEAAVREMRTLADEGALRLGIGVSLPVIGLMALGLSGSDGVHLRRVRHLVGQRIRPCTGGPLERDRQRNPIHLDHAAADAGRSRALDVWRPGAGPGGHRADRPSHRSRSRHHPTSLGTRTGHLGTVNSSLVLFRQVEKAPIRLRRHHGVPVTGPADGEAPARGASRRKAMGFDEGWEYDAEYGAEFDSEFDGDYDPEELYLSLIPDEERHRFWSESMWFDPIDDEFQLDSLLFAHRGAEVELSREIRLSELWASCQDRPFTMDEFLELSVLISEVEGLRGSLCADCAMLGRPNVSANWALAITTLCRGHLRFRLGHAQIDGGGTYRPS